MYFDLTLLTARSFYGCANFSWQRIIGKNTPLVITGLSFKWAATIFVTQAGEPTAFLPVHSFRSIG
jgi:hypothetical protein